MVKLCNFEGTGYDDFLETSQVSTFLPYALLTFSPCVEFCLLKEVGGGKAPRVFSLHLTVMEKLVPQGEKIRNSPPVDWVWRGTGRGKLTAYHHDSSARLEVVDEEDEEEEVRT